MQKRKLWEQLVRQLDARQALVITGPRRVGKTTTLQWLLEQTHSTNQIFFDLEKLTDRAIFEVVDYDDVINTLVARGLDVQEKMYVAIDEIQFLPNITSVIKYLYDHYEIKFFLSGSSSYYLKNQFTESMTGRKFLFELLPLGFQEFLDFRGVDYHLPEVDWEKGAAFPDLMYDRLKSEYEEFIAFGGFPEVVLAEKTTDKLRLLDEFYSTYINQDVLSLSDFRSTTELRRLIQLLAVRVGNRVNISELSEVSGIARGTVMSYLEFLEATYLIRTLPVESTSEDVKVRNLRKLYFIDNGIAGLNADLSSGQKFENVVCGQLAQYGQLSYYDNTRQEIDFILRPRNDGENCGGQMFGAAIALEAKETPTVSDLDDLRYVAQKKLAIEDFYLVGRQKSAKFADYLWGGMMG